MADELTARQKRTKKLIEEGLDPQLISSPKRVTFDDENSKNQRKQKVTYIPCPGNVIIDRQGKMTTFFEQLFDPVNKVTQFALMRGDKIERVNDVMDPFDDMIRYIPLADELLEKGFVSIARNVIGYESELALFNEIKRYIHKYYDTNSTMEDVLAAYAMLTYIYDKAPVMPIINFRGTKDTGKTRGANVLMKICYRGMRASGAASFASLFRAAERWKGTLLINEGDMSNSDETCDRTKYLNERYERDGGIWRTNPNTLDPEIFRAFGPTIITTRAEFGDDALESRCFLIISERTDRDDILLNLPPSFDEEATELRGKLLSFRFRWYPKFQNDYGLKFAGISTRLNQILQPLASMAKIIDPEFYQRIETIAHSFQEKQIDAVANSEDGLIIRAYFRLESDNIEVDRHNQGVEFDERWERKPITASNLASAIKELGGDVSATKIGRRASGLGLLQKATKSAGKSHREYYISTTKNRQQLIRAYLPKEERCVVEGEVGQATLDGPSPIISTGSE